MTDLPDWYRRRSCVDRPDIDWLPQREPVYERDSNGVVRFTGFQTGAGDNHGREAKAVCAACPVRVQCLTAAVAGNEQFGIFGGAGGQQRRWLRQAYVTDGAELGPVWTAAMQLHFAQLDGQQVWVNRNGPNAVHGRRSTFARGCDCAFCCDAAAFAGVNAVKPQRRRRSMSVSPGLPMRVATGRRAGSVAA